jgi:superfamily II RNA helicase
MMTTTMMMARKSRSLQQEEKFSHSVCKASEREREREIREGKRLNKWMKILYICGRSKKAWLIHFFDDMYMANLFIWLF